MPELNREEIIKALECWLKTFNGDVERFMLIANALTFIKKLTEEKREIFEEIYKLLFKHRVFAMIEDYNELKKKYIGE